MSTLVIQTAFLGDVVLTTPLLQRLAQRHGPVDVLVTPAAAALLENHPAAREVLRYDKRDRDAGWRGFMRLARLLRSRRYERVYLPHRSLRSAALAWWSGAGERIGFSGAPAAWSYTSRVPVAGTHETERLASLAGPGPVPRPSLGLTPDDRAAAKQWLEQTGIDQPFTAVAPGSVWATKRWPGYAELVAILSGPVVVIGGPEDAETGRAMAAANPGRIHSAAGSLSLRGSAALIEQARLLVTNDSAPLHLAGAVGTPVVAIFGPTVPAFGFGPLGETDRIVQHTELSCRPCSRHGPMVCPLGHHRCMREITVERVLAAARQQNGV